MMNIPQFAGRLIILGIISLLALSCSTSQPATSYTTNDDQKVATLKDELKFKTHFGLEGDTNIKAINLTEDIIDISALTVFLEQSSTKDFKVISLKDLGIASKVQAKEAVEMQVSLDQRIATEFNGVAGNYNLSIVYKSNVPLDKTDERNIYYISYKYDLR